MGILQAINDSAVGEEVRASDWLFPALETVHVIAIVFVVGSISRLDLRLLGLVWRERPVTDVLHEMLPWTWGAFVLATVFGLLLWTTKPIGYLSMAFFDVKLLLMALAGLNMLFFHVVVLRGVNKWDRDPIPPFAARFAGGLSLALWVSIVACGRFIGFI